jgi:hypothetical protein
VKTGAEAMLTICYLYLAIQMGEGAQGVPQGPYFVTQPSDRVGMAGDQLTLNCVIANMAGRCQWTKDGFGLGTDPDIPGYPRLAMVTENPGDCKLNIFPVMPEDEGEYQCQAGAVSGSPAIMSDRATVSVKGPPGQPYIKQAGDTDTLEVMEGEEVVLDCESTGAKPAAKMKWTNHKGQALHANLIEAVHRNVQSKTFRTVSTLKLKPTENLSLSCSAFSESFQEPRISRKLDIKIKHSPRLSLNILNEPIEEGHTLVVKCENKAYPSNVTFKWFLNNNEMEETSDMLKIENIPKKLNNAILTCEVENSIGKTKASKMLRVEFAPRFVTQPKTQIARFGEKVKLTCLADGNPKPSYVWLKGNPQEVVGVSENLILTATAETADDYSCRVFVEGQKPLISETAAVKIFKKPAVFTESEKQAKVGEDVILQCRVSSLSHNTKVSWTKNDQPIDKESPKHHILFSDGINNYASDLIIYNVEQSDFTNYGCFSTNEVGTDYKVLPLREEEDEYDFFSLILSINTCVGVILLVIIVIYHKRKNCMQERLEVEARLEQGRPNVGRNILPPIYTEEDTTAIQELLLDRRMHEDYHKFNQEFLNKKVLEKQ